MRSRGSFLAASGSLLLAGCGGGAAGLLTPVGTTLSSSKSSVVRSDLAAATTSTFTAGSQTGIVYSDSTYQNLWGSTTDGMVSYTMALTPDGNGGGNLAYSFIQDGANTSGSCTVTVSGSSVSATHSDGTVISYSTTDTTVTGTATRGSAVCNLSATLGTTSLSSTITGAVNSSFASTNPYLRGGSTTGCTHACPLVGVQAVARPDGTISRGSTGIAISFAGAGLFLAAIGLEPFAAACGVIAVGFDVYGYYHDKN
jgi:hypothetical protein